MGAGAVCSRCVLGWYGGARLSLCGEKVGDITAPRFQGDKPLGRSTFQGGGKSRPYPIRLGAAVVLEAKSIFSQLLCMFKGGKLCKHIMLFPGAIGAEMLCASFACWQC